MEELGPLEDGLLRVGSVQQLCVLWESVSIEPRVRLEAKDELPFAKDCIIWKNSAASSAHIIESICGHSLDLLDQHHLRELHRRIQSIILSDNEHANTQQVSTWAPGGHLTFKVTSTTPHIPMDTQPWVEIEPRRDRLSLV